MRQALAPGTQAYTYGFAEHGELPGMATFDITTDFAEGTAVQVYRYEPETSQFSLIAGNVPVGKAGTVGYRNHTMSEYLVTTQALTGALRSEVVDLQDFNETDFPWDWMLGIGLGLAAALIGGVVVWKRRRVKESNLRSTWRPYPFACCYGNIRHTSKGIESYRYVPCLHHNK